MSTRIADDHPAIAARLRQIAVEREPITEAPAPAQAPPRVLTIEERRAAWAETERLREQWRAMPSAF